MTIAAFVIVSIKSINNYYSSLAATYFMLNVLKSGWGIILNVLCASKRQNDYFIPNCEQYYIL